MKNTWYPLIGSDYSALLGYNEPNWKGQAEMTVEEALNTGRCWRKPD